MPNYITTYGGTHLVPTDPQPDQIHITDIAHALSLICRGNGQVQTFFSVGQHCIHCALEAKARGYSPKVVLACLLHDSGEAYLSDVPRPFKKFLPEYHKWETQFLTLVYTKYLGSPLLPEEAALVDRIDDDMLFFDLRELLHDEPDCPEPLMKTDFSYEVLPFQQVEQQYLKLFSQFQKEL